MLRHPDAFTLLSKKYTDAKKVITKELELLINMLDFNPYTYDQIQYFWYDSDEGIMYPEGEWKIPMGDASYVFDKEGFVIDLGNKPYTGWTTDYYMYTYNETKILEEWKSLCAEV